MDTNCSYFAAKYAPVTLVERLWVYSKFWTLYFSNTLTFLFSFYNQVECWVLIKKGGLSCNKNLDKS